MIVSEIVKIKEAQLLNAHKNVEKHVFSYDEKLYQLKHDLMNKWVPGCESTDLKMYSQQIAREHEMKPEEIGQLTEYDRSPEDFKDTLTKVASILNASNKTHVILMDEVELKNVSNEGEGNVLEVDLSYLAEFVNIHFIFCLRPARYGVNNFTISCNTLQQNQHFCYLKNVYRNAEAIQKVVRNFQQHQIDSKSEGHAMMEEVMNVEKLPPPLKLCYFEKEEY